MAAAEVGELPAFHRRHEHLAGVRVRECGPGAAQSIRLIQDRCVAGKHEAPGSVRDVAQLLARAAGDGLASFSKQGHFHRLLAVEAHGELARVEGAAVEGVHVSGAVGRADERPVDVVVERFERCDVTHRRLAVIRHYDEGIPRQQLVDTSGRFHECADRVVAAHERVVCGAGAELVRGVIEVGEVEDEEVEAVACDEPAGDSGRIGVDRTGRPVPPRQRRSGPFRLVQVVEEEPLGATDVVEHRQQRPMRRAAAVGREVDGRSAQSGVGQCLEQRHRPPPQMLGVHVDERVTEGAPDSGGAHRPERASVFDEALLAAVVPDEMRDPCTSPCAPVAIEERQTGVSDGNTDTARP